jgi:hypothetical protein
MELGSVTLKINNQHTLRASREIFLCRGGLGT